MSNLEKLRSAALGGSDYEKIEVKVGDNLYQLVEPTLEERDEIYERASFPTPDGKTVKVRSGLLRIWSVIMMTRDPQSGQRLFTEADLDVLKSRGSKSIVAKLGDKAIKLLNDIEEETPKNSDPTPGSNSATS